MVRGGGLITQKVVKPTLLMNGESGGLRGAFKLALLVNGERCGCKRELFK